jgi:YbgC/YbaW family acyl-CoA thioester hydrolase
VMVLPDPAGRDAGIHAVQACIPHCRLLPTGADRIAIRSATATGLRSVHARERYRDGDLFAYDLELIGEDGTLQEIWEGLRLKKVEAIPPAMPWAVPLLSPYLERRLQELIPDAKLTVALRHEDNQPRRARSEAAIQQALGKPVAIHQRPDGKPETLTEQSVSAAHAGQVTLAVCAPGPVGCDLEPVVSRPEATWRDLLGAQKMQLAELIAREQAEDIDCAATRVWGVLEGLKKAGFTADAPLVFASRQSDGWVMLESGSLAAASYLTRVRGLAARLAVVVVAAPAGRAPSHVDGYHYSHVVGFEETNVVGNVYYTNYLLWQGRCREAFLREKAPEILQLMKMGHHLATTRCSCEYFTELKAFDEIDVHMRLKCLQREYIELGFEYWRTTGGQKQLVARGQQQIACILPNGTRAVPDILRTALEPYATKPLLD